MTQPKCPCCLQVISLDDTVCVRAGRIVHLDCQRPRELTREERILVFRFCWGHIVAKCPACALSFRQHQLGSDLLGHRSHLCPRCRADLSESLRAHLFACPTLPEQLRLRAREVRDVARRLVKESGQLRDRAEVLMREAEAAVAALRETMQGTAWRD